MRRFSRIALLLVVTPTFVLSGCQLLQNLAGTQAQAATAQTNAAQTAATAGQATPTLAATDGGASSAADLLASLGGAASSEAIPQLQDTLAAASTDADAAAATGASAETAAAAASGQLLKSGQASWYGADFHGRPTANGETYNMNAMTAAMTGVPLGITVKVVRTDTGRSVTVRVNDRGPYERSGGKWVPHSSRVIDLSKAAMAALGGIDKGVVPVKVYQVG